jgi:hypothetical protein
MLQTAHAFWSLGGVGGLLLLRCTVDLTMVVFGRRTLAGRGKNELRSRPPKRESAYANGSRAEGVARARGTLAEPNS